MKYAGHKSCNLGTFKDINRTKERSKVFAAQSKLVMQIFLFNMYNYFDRALGSAFFKQTTLGHDFCFHLNFIVFFFSHGYSAEGDAEGGKITQIE